MEKNPVPAEEGGRACVGSSLLFIGKPWVAHFTSWCWLPHLQTGNGDPTWLHAPKPAP